MSVIQTVRIVDLRLDEENPRLEEPNIGQAQAITALIKKMTTVKFMKLAESICENGLDPSSLPIAIESKDPKGSFKMVEGNRRLVALKALTTPELVTPHLGSTYSAKLKKLSKKFHENPIEEIDCVIFGNQNDSDKWLILRHTGEQNGVGVVGWKAPEKDRFLARRGILASHTQLLEWLQQRGRLPQKDRHSIPVSTVARLVGSPPVRKVLGIDVTRGQLVIVGEDKQVEDAAMFVIEKLLAKELRVTDVYHAKDREEFAKNFPPNLIPTPRKTGEQEFAEAEASTDKQSSKPAKHQKRFNARSKLIPSDCVMNVSDARIARIEHELRQINVDQYPNAVSVLLRVFLELTTDSYILRENIPNTSEKDSLGKKINAAVNNLETKKKLSNQQSKAMRRYTSSDGQLPSAIKHLHSYIHNQYSFPTTSDLTGAWDNLQAYLASCWNP